MTTYGLSSQASTKALNSLTTRDRLQPCASSAVKEVAKAQDQALVIVARQLR
jgi:hypothetical protein